MRNQLIAAVPTIYIAALRELVIGFRNTSTFELMAHLHDMYGGVTGSELGRNT
jgi:hypothetical protein